MAIVGLVLLSVQFSLALSTAYYQRKAMVQQMALLENRVSQLERALEKGSDPPAAAESSADSSPSAGERAGVP